MAWEDHAEQVLPYTDPVYGARAAWLALRRTGLGGSDARVLMGHGYADESPFKVLQSKLLDLPERPDNIRMRRGTHMEAFIGEEFYRTELAGSDLSLQRTGTWRNRERPWQLANPDWRIGETEGMEGKHVDNYASAKAYRMSEAPPSRFYWQCVDYMDTVGASGWWLAIDSPHYSELLTWYLAAEDCAADMLLLRERMGNWWTHHVVHGFELDGGSAPVRPDFTPNPDTVAEATVPELVLDALGRRRELKYPGTRAGKDEAKRIDELFKAQIGNADVLAVDGVPVLRWQSRRNPGQPDWAAIEAATGKSKDQFMSSGATSWYLAEINPTKED